MQTLRCLCIRICLFYLLIVCTNQAFAQLTDFPYSGETIKIDSFGKTDKSLPFDRPFYLERDKIETEGIESIELFQVKYKSGQRLLYPDCNDKSKYTADYIFQPKDIIKEKNKLTLIVPPLKPNRDLDILVFRSVTGTTLTAAYEFNETLIKGPLVLGSNAAGQTTVIANPVLKSQFDRLKKEANNNPSDVTRGVFSRTISEFYRNITVPSKIFYSEAVNEANLRTNGPLSEQNIWLIKRLSTYLDKKVSDLYLLEQMKFEARFHKVMYGYLPYNSNFLTEEEIPNSFTTRISNLKGSLDYFESIYKSLNELVILDPDSYTSIRSEVQNIVIALNFNFKFLKDRLEQITDLVKKNAKEAVWLMGTTQSKDLQTKGANIFALDLGVSNIWVRDIDDRISYIPKLFYGVNIFFRPVDKNIKSKYFLNKQAKAGNEDYNVISRGSFFQRFCITAGFTIGTIDKNNFSNFFGGTSLLIGPSYRFGRTFRVSSGVVFLKRSDKNYLLSDKRYTTGFHASLSLDLDILGTLGKAIGLLNN